MDQKKIARIRDRWHRYLLGRTARIISFIREHSELKRREREKLEKLWKPRDRELLFKLRKEELLRGSLKLHLNFLIFKEPQKFAAFKFLSDPFCQAFLEMPGGCDLCPYGQRKGVCTTLNSVQAKAKELLIQRFGELPDIPLRTVYWRTMGWLVKGLLSDPEVEELMGDLFDQVVWESLIANYKTLGR